jgi:GAF domain-containing protein
MEQINNTLFSTANYSSEAQRNRARLVYYTTVILMALYAIYALFLNYRSGRTLVTSLGNDPLAVFHLVSVYGIGIATILLTRMGALQVASYGPQAMLYTGVVLLGFVQGYVFADDTLALLLVIFFSGLFTSLPGLIGTTIVIFLTFSVNVVLRPELGLPDNITASQMANFETVVIQIIATAAVTYLYLRTTVSRQIEARVESAQERLKSAEITTDIARNISQRVPLDTVLSQTVDRIRDSYEAIYHAQIFLIGEEGRNAALRASTGEAGQALLERQHSLAVGSQSVIGQVTYQGEPVIARTGLGQTIHRRNEFLPDTRVEAAFPLQVGSEIIGALDLQSIFADAFHEDEIPIFQALADSLAVAIDNARLFQETEQRLYENQRLVEQTREAAHQVEILNRQLTGRAWEYYLGSQADDFGLSVNFENRSSQTEVEETPSLSEAMSHNHIVQQPVQDGAGQMIAFPLRVRGQVIGAMEFELTEAGTLTPEDFDLIQQVGERFGLAAENIRLFDESQRIARREAAVNEVSARLQKTNDIESVLTEAAQSLHDTLKVGKVAIRLGMPPTTQEMQANGKS